MKISEALEIFYKAQLVKGNQETTVQAYKSQLQPFLNYTNNIEISKLNYELYCDYILHLRNQKRKLSTVTIHSYANALKIFFNFLYEEKIILQNVAAEIKKLPKQLYTIPKIITPEEIQKIFNESDLKNKMHCRNVLIFVLAFDSGLRLSELIRLQIQDFDYINRLIRVTGKWNKQRNVPLTDTILYYLQEYLKFYKYRDTGQLLLSNRDLPITNSAIKTLFKRIKKKYNFAEFHPHLLRHSFATLFLKNGGDSLVLQDILGHTTLEMTKRYVHLANSIKMAEQRKYSPMTKSKDEGLKENPPLLGKGGFLELLSSTRNERRSKK